MKQFSTSVLLLFICCYAFGQSQSGLDFYIKASQAKKAGQYEQAILNYEFALQREPNNHFYLYEKGLCEFLMRRLPNAAATLATVVKLRSDYTPAYVLLAKIALANNDTKKVVENLDLAVKYEKDNSKKINYRLFAMTRLVRDGDFTQAYERVRAAYQLSQEDTAVVYYHAKMSNLLGKYAEAEAVLQKFLPKIAAQPQSAKAKYYYELGFAQFQQGQYEKANNSWKQADWGVFKSRIERFSAKNFAAAALTYFRMYEDSTANYYAEKALAIEKGFPAAHVILVQLAKRKVDHTITLPQLQNAVRHETNAAKRKEMLMNIAEQQFQLGRFEESAQTLNELLAVDADNQRAQLLRVLIPYHKKNYRAAIAATDALIKKTSDFSAQAPYIFLQGLALKKIGQKEEAVKTFRRLLSTPLAAAANIEIDQLVSRIGNDDDFNLKLVDPPENAK